MSETLGGIVSTAIALGVGLGLVLFCKKRLLVDAGALLVAVLFAPAVLFLGLSGKLVEFKGLGVEAKFREVASKKVAPTNLKPLQPSVAEVQSLQDAKSYLGIGTEVVLLRAPERDADVSHMQVFDVAAKIYPGLLQGKFETLVVIDGADKVLGYFSKEVFYDLLRIEIEQSIRGSRKEFDRARVRDQLEQTELWNIVAYPRQRAELAGLRLVLSTADSNTDALRKLATADQSVAVVAGKGGIYSGIVRRADIVAEMLVALAS